MDLGGSSNIGANVDLSKMTDSDKQQLQQFVVNESQKARIQSCTSLPPPFSTSSPSPCYSYDAQPSPSATPLHYCSQFQCLIVNSDTCANTHTAIHSLTDTCFRKCIPAGTIKKGALDKYEEPCMRQCVDRFLDANLVVLKELERLRQ